MASFHGKTIFYPGESRYGSFYALEELPQYYSIVANLMLGLQIDHAQEDGTVVFQDGSSIKADVIMHCTGYSDLQSIIPFPTKACHFVLI